MFVVIGGLLGQSVTRGETYRHLRVFEDVISLVRRRTTSRKSSRTKVMSGAMRGLADGLDGDSAFLPPDLVRLVERGRAKRLPPTSASS